MFDLLSRMDPGWLVFVGVFLGALLLVEGLRQLSSRRETDAEARSRRLRLIARGTTAPERLEILLPAGGATRPFLGLDLGQRLVAAGLPAHPAHFGLWSLALMLMTGLVLLPFVGAAAAFGIGLFLWGLVPLVALNALRAARLARITAQLPDALDLVARALKAGHPLSASIATVAETMPDPIGTEFGIMVDQISFGDELVVAFRKLAERNPTEDFQTLAVSIAIQHGTGGNLGRVLGVMAAVMRGRFLLRRKIKAMSAEGRISALILSGIPFLMFGMNMVVSPSYYGDVMGQPLFVPMALAAVSLVVLNAVILFRLVNFRI